MKFLKKRPLTDDDCWDLIAKANKKALKKDNDLNVYLDYYLEKLLKKLSVSDLLYFHLFVTQRDKELQTDFLTGVCWLINEVGHGDTFWDFRSWIIFMGKDVFNIAQNNPDSLIEYVRKSEDGYCYLDDGGPSVSSLIEELYEKKKISKEEYLRHEKEIDQIIEIPFKETNCWQKHSDLKKLFPKLSEYAIERDGPNCFNV